LDQLKVNTICDLIQDYSHELQNKSQFFDGININIADDVPIDCEQISSKFSNGFYFHSNKHIIRKDRFGVIINDRIDLFLLLRFDGYKLQKCPEEMNALWTQQFPLLRTFSPKKHICIFNEMENNKKQKRTVVEKVPESFSLLCDKIHSSILQWYIDKPITKLFH
jgi:hypothetical protein